MKFKTFKVVTLLMLFTIWFSCTKDEDDSNAFKWNGS